MTLGALTTADAAVVAAAVSALGAVIVAVVGLIGGGALNRRVKKVERTGAAVFSEVTPNHGTSMKDQVTRLEQRAATLETAFTGHDARLQGVERSQTRTESGVRLLLEAAGIPVERDGASGN